MRYDNEEGLTIHGWAWDHILGAPKAIRVYAGNQIVFTGRPNQMRLDIEAGAKAGFAFFRAQNPVLRNIMAKGCEIAVYVTFDGLKWSKLPFAPGAEVKLPGSI